MDSEASQQTAEAKGARMGPRFSLLPLPVSGRSGRAAVRAIWGKALAAEIGLTVTSVEAGAARLRSSGLIQPMLFPPFRPGAPHVMGLWPIPRGRAVMTGNKSEQSEPGPSQR